MLMLLALPVIVAVTEMNRYLQLYAPTNLLVRRTRAGRPRWRNVAALLVLASSLLVVMHALTVALASGGPAWLNLVVLVLGWDAIKLCGLAGIQVVRCVLVLTARHRLSRTDVLGICLSAVGSCRGLERSSRGWCGLSADLSATAGVVPR